MKGFPPEHCLTLQGQFPLELVGVPMAVGGGEHGFQVYRRDLFPAEPLEKAVHLAGGKSRHYQQFVREKLPSFWGVLPGRKALYALQGLGKILLGHGTGPQP